MRILGKRKINGKWYRNIGSYETRIKAQEQAARWLRDGYPTKIIKSEARQNKKAPWNVYVLNRKTGEA